MERSLLACRYSLLHIFLMLSQNIATMATIFTFGIGSPNREYRAILIGHILTNVSHHDLHTKSYL